MNDSFYIFLALGLVIISGLIMGIIGSNNKLIDSDNQLNYTSNNKVGSAISGTFDNNPTNTVISQSLTRTTRLTREESTFMNEINSEYPNFTVEEQNAALEIFRNFNNAYDSCPNFKIAVNKQDEEEGYEAFNNCDAVPKRIKTISSEWHKNDVEQKSVVEYIITAYKCISLNFKGCATGIAGIVREHKH